MREQVFLSLCLKGLYFLDLLHQWLHLETAQVPSDWSAANGPPVLVTAVMLRPRLRERLQRCRNDDQELIKISKQPLSASQHGKTAGPTRSVQVAILHIWCICWNSTETLRNAFKNTNKLIRSVFIIGSLSATETNFWNFRTCDNDLWSNDEGKRKHPLVLSDNRKGGQGGQGGQGVQETISKFTTNSADGYECAQSSKSGSFWNVDQQKKK